MLDDAIDLLPPAKPIKLVSGYLDVKLLRPDAPGKKNLLADVRAFDAASRAGKYYESFNVNSKNFMDKSTGTRAFIASKRAARNRGSGGTTRDGSRSVWARSPPRAASNSGHGTWT
jgi:hypothetical protein